MNGTHQCDSFNFCGSFGPQHTTTALQARMKAPWQANRYTPCPQPLANASPCVLPIVSTWSTLPHTKNLQNTCPDSLSLSLSLSLSFSLSLTLSLSLSLSLTLSHFPIHLISHSLNISPTFSLSHFLTFSLSHL